jgi:dihydroorotate dehydrogenase (NAD+) catalytic subunit
MWRCESRNDFVGRDCMIQTYDIEKSYQENYDRGPMFPGQPRAVPAGPMKKFLGLDVCSRLGISAGLLLNSKWVLGYAQRGFDILTYKTVRSSFRPCYDQPNWVFVEDDGGDGPVYATDRLPEDPSQVASAVCFGMPSMAPQTWREDVKRARAALGPGKVLIVSVVATPNDDAKVRDVADDFAQVAAWAADAGADVVEANLSCPNVCTKEGNIYTDAQMSRTIAAAVRKAIGSKPLLLKAGHFHDATKLKTFLKFVNGLADGITMVNAVSRPVLQPNGRPVFGDVFVKAGVVGRGIHKSSVQGVRRVAEAIQADNLKLAVVGVGGASTDDDVQDFFDAGAAAVLMGSAPMYMPDLAAEMKTRHPDW